MLPVTVSSRAVTREFLELSIVSRVDVLVNDGGASERSILLLFGQLRPQLIALRKLASPAGAGAVLGLRGDEENIR